MKPERRPIVIEHVRPAVDDGRYPAKRVVGDTLAVSADIFKEGHDLLAARVCYRRRDESGWHEAPLRLVDNDGWGGAFRLEANARYLYTVEAWTDTFGSWGEEMRRRIKGGQADLTSELLEGAEMVRRARATVSGADQAALARALERVAGASSQDARLDALLDGDLRQLMARVAPRPDLTRYDRELEVVVDRPEAGFAAWYEMFPRSQGRLPGRHGTFDDCIERLPDIRRMGFDVVYLPPIHPIGRTARKGPDNALDAGPSDPGSPWAIGGPEGGHTAVHPELGDLETFRRLVKSARGLGLEIALDFAIQCSPDHPWVREHPEWFHRRPDGTIKYAENPPKKYQDIFPFDFETESWRELWDELLSIVNFWIDQGVHILRVDNPHTKPFAFWEWLIGEVKREHPEVILLAEAFTRPKVMYRLAKLGFSQSYTYFAWRNTSWELTQYFNELSQPPVREYFRPNLWPNTPDILTEYLQTGGRAAFAARFVLAATLGASYGIYGPAFELCEGRAREPGSEEYLDSEKYQVRAWDRDSPDNLRELITLINKIRHENPALQSDRGLRFHPTENDQLIAYTKSTSDLADIVLTVVNLDPHHSQAGMVTLPLDELGIERDRSYQAHELLSGARYLWTGPRNYVEINPYSLPAQIFRFRRRIRSEHDFEYFL